MSNQHIVVWFVEVKLNIELFGEFNINIDKKDHNYIGAYAKRIKDSENLMII
jgi:hypothetical protein